MQFNAFKAVVDQRLNEYETVAEFCFNSKYEDMEIECENLKRSMDAFDIRNDDMKISCLKGNSVFLTQLVKIYMNSIYSYYLLEMMYIYFGQCNFNSISTERGTWQFN